jgi:hypothetical protein
LGHLYLNSHTLAHRDRHQSDEGQAVRLESVETEHHRNLDLAATVEYTLSDMMNRNSMAVAVVPAAGRSEVLRLAVLLLAEARLSVRVLVDSSVHVLARLLLVAGHL